MYMYVAYHLSLFVFVKHRQVYKLFSIVCLLGSNIRVSIVLFFVLNPSHRHNLPRYRNLRTPVSRRRIVS